MNFPCRGIKHEMLVALAAACLWCTIPGAWGQKTNDAATPPLPQDVRILAYANPRTATVGDPIRIDLDISMPQGYHAEILKPAVPSPDFSIMDFLPGPALPDEKKPTESAQAGVHHRSRIAVAVYRTGKFTFPPVPIKIKTAAGKEIAAASPPVEIEIRSVLAEKNPALKDLKKQAEISEPTRWLLWGILALAACLLCALIWYFLRRRRRKSVPLTPVQKQNQLELAEADLRDLLARGFPEKGGEKQFYVRLSDIVKRILSAGYGIHTAEQTTSEIMETLGWNSVPGLEEKQRIESFLLRCDVVKFAKYVPSAEEHANAGEYALHVLAEAKETVGSR